MQWIHDILLKLGVEDPSSLLGNIVGKMITILVVFVVMRIVIRFGNKFIDNFFMKQTMGRFSIEKRRATTLTAIVKSVFFYLVLFIGIMIVASMFVDITSIIALAGVGSLAVAFGAQSLVEDFVTGFFIFFDDQFSVGDYVTLVGYSGIVETLGLRTTQLRDFSGDLHIIPNGEISQVTNHSRGNMRAMVDVRVTYEENIQKSMEILERVCDKIGKENKNIVEGPYVLGIEELDDLSMKIRVTAQTKNMEQWGVERDLRKAIKDTFDQEGIKIPYPKRVVHLEKQES